MPETLFRSVALLALTFLSACDQVGSRQDAIFLPPGDAARGEALFVSLGCAGCHGVMGVDFAEPAAPGPVRVLLGTRAGRTLTYNELVTSIVNPSHRLSARYRRDEVSQEGVSLMATYNDVLTVTQLTDLVAFLEAHYEKAARPGYSYPVYRYQAVAE